MELWLKEASGGSQLLFMAVALTGGRERGGRIREGEGEALTGPLLLLMNVPVATDAGLANPAAKAWGLVASAAYVAAASEDISKHTPAVKMCVCWFCCDPPPTRVTKLIIIFKLLLILLIVIIRIKTI